MPKKHQSNKIVHVKGYTKEDGTRVHGHNRHVKK